MRPVHFGSGSTYPANKQAGGAGCVRTPQNPKTRSTYAPVLTESKLNIACSQLQISTAKMGQTHLAMLDKRQQNIFLVGLDQARRRSLG